MLCKTGIRKEKCGVKEKRERRTPYTVMTKMSIGCKSDIIIVLSYEGCKSFPLASHETIIKTKNTNLSHH